MNEPRIFYAWQSDRSEKVCRYVVRDAAKDAIKALASDADIEDSPRLDSDTQGEAGHPEIARTIFGKIDDAAVFLADLTLTGEAAASDGRKKRVANANVLLELGYASARTGWKRIVLVMNEAFGKPEEQLFDILHRRHPITYHLLDDDKVKMQTARKSLAEDLKQAFKAAFAARHDKVTSLIRKLDAHCVRLMRYSGRSDFFSERNPNEFAVGSSTGLDTPVFNAAVLRLLDLDLIHSDFNAEGGLYAYHWTYFGKEVLKALKIRE